MAERLNVVLCLHAHLPDCRDHVTGQFQRPWVYLRGIGEYTQLADCLEARFDAGAVVCMSPIVLEQLADYRDQLESWLRDGRRIADPVLGLLSAESYPQTPEARMTICEKLLAELPRPLAQQFPACAHLVDLVGVFLDKRWDFRWLSDVAIGDLLVWFHLAWFASSAHRDDMRIELLVKKASGFSSADRRVVVEIIADLLTAIPQRYRSLHESGRVELAASLYASPSLRALRHGGVSSIPREMEHEADWSASAEEHLERQLRMGVEAFEAFFGMAPNGCCIPAGQPPAARHGLLANFDWVATGTTAVASGPGEMEPVAPRYTLVDGMAGRDSLDLGRALGELGSLAQRCAHPGACMVPIVFDLRTDPTQATKTFGAFLEMCAALSDNPDFRLCTFSQALTDRLEACHLHFTAETRSDPTGDEGASSQTLWPMVKDAKDAYLDVVASRSLPEHRLQAATRQLMVCEDATWLRDSPPLEGDTRGLCLMHLENLYRILGVPVPRDVSEGTSASHYAGVQ